jgi:hypothetical protein
MLSAGESFSNRTLQHQPGDEHCSILATLDIFAFPSDQTVMRNIENSPSLLLCFSPSQTFPPAKVTQ